MMPPGWVGLFFDNLNVRAVFATKVLCLWTAPSIDGLSLGFEPQH
jgi:hypothetical protein